MTQKGEHTWDLILHYHACPKCGYIQESRSDYFYCLGKYLKEITCERCGIFYEVEKKRRVAPFPLIGEPEPPEIEWRS